MKTRNYANDKNGNEKDDDLQPRRNGQIGIACRLFGDQGGRDWLDNEYSKLGTTRQSATRDALVTVGRKLIALMDRKDDVPSDLTEDPRRVFTPEGEILIPVEPPAEPQPAVEDHDVLREIAEEKIEPEQVQHLETLAAQYRLHPMDFAALARGYGADSLDQLKKVDYRRLISDILRTGAAAGGRKKAPPR